MVKGMKIDKTVIKETAYIAFGTVALDAVMILIYSFITDFRFDMLYSAAFGSLCAVMNFFFMAYTLQKAVDINSEDCDDKAEKVQLKVKSSYAVRTMIFVLTLAVALITGWFDTYALLIPVLFPNIIARIRMIYLNMHGE